MCQVQIFDVRLGAKHWQDEACDPMGFFATTRSRVNPCFWLS